MKVEKESWDVIFERLYGNLNLQRRVVELENELAGIEFVHKAIASTLKSYVRVNSYRTDSDYVLDIMPVPYHIIEGIYEYVCKTLQKENKNV